MTKTKTSKTKITKTEAEAALAQRGLGTKEQALERRVALDVAKWGEGERDASRRLHQSRSYGLLLNSIAHANVDMIDVELAALAKVILTSADHRVLSQGG